MHICESSPVMYNSLSILICLLLSTGVCLFAFAFDFLSLPRTPNGVASPVSTGSDVSTG